MKILYYDCFSGISGDMNLGVMVDLGVDKKHLVSELSKLKLDQEFEIEFTNGLKRGITGTKVDIVLTNKACYNPKTQTEITKTDNHFHHDYVDGTKPQTIIDDKDHHHHFDNAKNNVHFDDRLDSLVFSEDKHYHKHNRYLKDIYKIINDSDLSENVKNISLNIFMKIAIAEAKVHGKSIYEVHFHEVGAIDSIIDVVGAAISIDYLKVDKIMSSSIQVGGGFVKCAHGIIPVPVPATVEILKGVPLRFGAVESETTTPTGAAIIATLVEEYTDKIEFVIDKIGYGIGNKDFEIPNVLRAYLGTNLSDNNKSEASEEQFIIETNIDDMNPEFYNYVESKLFENGALDVYMTQIIMKKGRPAIKLSVLVCKEKEKEILDIIFKETTSIGFRKYKVEKIKLERTYDTIKTKYGDVTIKNSYYEGKLIKHKAEYEDCKRLAIENNVPINLIYKEVEMELYKPDFDK